jgi:hypothetical protein
MQPVLYEIMEAFALAELGLIIMTDKPEKLRQSLYPALKEYDILATIQIIDGDVWLVKKSFVELG